MQNKKKKESKVTRTNNHTKKKKRQNPTFSEWTKSNRKQQHKKIARDGQRMLPQTCRPTYRDCGQSPPICRAWAAYRIHGSRASAQKGKRNAYGSWKWTVSEFSHEVLVGLITTVVIFFHSFSIFYFLFRTDIAFIFYIISILRYSLLTNHVNNLVMVGDTPLTWKIVEH